MTERKIGVDSEWSEDLQNKLVPMILGFVESDPFGLTKVRRAFWRDQMEEAKDYIKAHKSDIFVAHNVEGAEGRVWWALGLDPT
jgi:hypothetical protein